MSGPLRCLWCSQTLPIPTDPASLATRALPVGYVTCFCGVRYAPELVLDADRETWEYIRQRDGYVVRRDGDVLWIIDDPEEPT